MHVQMTYHPHVPIHGRAREARPMKKRKALKEPGFMRSVLATNVAAVMELRLPGYPDKIRELARRAGMSRSSVQRMVQGQHGASVDLIERVAAALGVAAYQLLVPGLDASDPQVIEGAADAQVKAYRQWKRDQATP